MDDLSQVLRQLIRQELQSMQQPDGASGSAGDAMSPQAAEGSGSSSSIQSKANPTQATSTTQDNGAPQVAEALTRNLQRLQQVVAEAQQLAQEVETLAFKEGQALQQQLVDSGGSGRVAPGAARRRQRLHGGAGSGSQYGPN